MHAWAVEGNLPPDYQFKSNSFEMEWPPHSGQRQTFPEVDHAEFFSAEAARGKINPAQAEFLDRLAAVLKQ